MILATIFEAERFWGNDYVPSIYIKEEEEKNRWGSSEFGVQSWENPDKKKKSLLQQSSSQEFGVKDFLFRESTECKSKTPPLLESHKLKKMGIEINRSLFL